MEINVRIEEGLPFPRKGLRVPLNRLAVALPLGAGLSARVAFDQRLFGWIMCPPCRTATVQTDTWPKVAEDPAGEWTGRTLV